MPPLETMPGTNYCEVGSAEFTESMAKFQAGETVLLRVEDGGTARTLYFFSGLEATADEYQLPIVVGMMEGVIKGASYGEFFADFETYEAIGEHPLTTEGKADLSAIEPIVIDQKGSRLSKLLSKLRGN